MNPTPPFAFGQTVYVPHAWPNYQTYIPCPICDGKRRVTVILGNGEHVSVECEFCSRGYEGPQGVVLDYRPMSRVETTTVRGLSYENGAWEIRTSEHYTEREVYATPEEAEARRIVLHAEAEKQALANFEQQFKLKKKNATWLAGYHRREIAELRRKLEWHESKAARLAAPDQQEAR